MKRINITFEFEVDQSISDELLNNLPLAIRNNLEDYLPGTVQLQHVVADVMGNNYYIVPFTRYNNQTRYLLSRYIVIESEVKPTFDQMTQAIFSKYYDSGDYNVGKLHNYRQQACHQLLCQTILGGVILTDKGRQIVDCLPQNDTDIDIIRLVSIDTISKG